MSKILAMSTVISGLVEDIEVSNISQDYPIRSNLQDRRIESLVDSIKQHGLLQPIIVRTKGELYEIVAGNRRLLACKKLGWRKISCNVVELEDKEAFEVAITENLERKTMNPIEEAHAFKAYISDYGWGGVSELASKIGRSVSFVTKRIKLLDLAPEVIDAIINSKLNSSAAEELISLKNTDIQSQLSQLISQRHLSHRNIRRLVKENHNDDNSHIKCDEDISDDKIIDYLSNYQSKFPNKLQEKQRAFDKSITALRIAMNRIGSIMESFENDWIAFDILMQHRNILHTQIDILIKERRKLELLK